MFLSEQIIEAPLNFRPTYKFAVGSNSYDSGGKNRIPSWTDRILYIDSKMHCFEYDSDPSIMTSDHKPVYASFVADVNFDDKLKEDIVQAIKDKLAPKFIAESQVCTIM